jgi:hypothetical protein
MNILKLTRAKLNYEKVMILKLNHPAPHQRLYYQRIGTKPAIPNSQ